ncbi:MAG: DNA gyrase inhibitor YacG [Candidatus Rokubacteria bacterium]|nr:DNA gyrase inhibitor YacG [Candidatus Rokubacteria bacterium]
MGRWLLRRGKSVAEPCRPDENENRPPASTLYGTARTVSTRSRAADARQVRELTRFVGGRYDRSINPPAHTSGRDSASRGVACPTCGARRPWIGNPQRPFCSLTCRLIDLGHWLDERYRFEDTTPPENDDDAR